MVALDAGACDFPESADGRAAVGGGPGSRGIGGSGFILRDLAGEQSRPASPGMLQRHYAPATPLRLAAREVARGEALLAFGPGLQHEGVMLNLSPGGDLIEAAANLFAHLRRLDSLGVSGIAVMPIPNEGLGEAINDRLRRAARPA